VDGFRYYPAFSCGEPEDSAVPWRRCLHHLKQRARADMSLENKPVSNAAASQQTLNRHTMGRTAQQGVRRTTTPPLRNHRGSLGCRGRCARGLLVLLVMMLFARSGGLRGELYFDLTRSGHHGNAGRRAGRIGHSGRTCCLAHGHSAGGFLQQKPLCKM